MFFKLEFKPGGGFLKAFTSQKGPGTGLPASGFARGSGIAAAQSTSAGVLRRLHPPGIDANMTPLMNTTV